MIPKFFDGVTHLSDARFAAAQGFEYISLNLDPQNNGISLEEAQEILGWISGPLLVGSFGNNPVAVVLDAVQLLSLDAVIAKNVPEGVPSFQVTVDGNLLSPEGILFREFEGDSEHVREWVQAENVEGIILHSTSEEKVGLRDFNDLIELLEELEGI